MSIIYDQALAVRPFFIAPSGASNKEAAVMFAPPELGERTDEFVNHMARMLSIQKARLPVTTQLFWFGGSLAAVVAIKNRDPSTVLGRPGLSLIYGVLISPEKIRYQSRTFSQSFELLHSYLEDEFQTTMSISGANTIIAKCQDDLPIDELITSKGVYRLTENFESMYGFREQNKSRLAAIPLLRSIVLPKLGNESGRVNSFPDTQTMLAYWSHLDRSTEPKRKRRNVPSSSAAPDHPFVPIPEWKIGEEADFARRNLFASTLAVLLLAAFNTGVELMTGNTQGYISPFTSVVALVALAMSSYSLSISVSMWRLRHTHSITALKTFRLYSWNSTIIGLAAAHLFLACAWLPFVVLAVRTWLSSGEAFIYPDR